MHTPQFCYNLRTSPEQVEGGDRFSGRLKLKFRTLITRKPKTGEDARRKEARKIADDDDDDDDDVVEHVLKSPWLGLIMQDLPALV
jgi:hypothetical protein